MGTRAGALQSAETRLTRKEVDLARIAGISLADYARHKRDLWLPGAAQPSPKSETLFWSRRWGYMLGTMAQWRGDHARAGMKRISLDEVPDPREMPT